MKVICDVVYVMRLETFHEEVSTAQLLTGLSLAFGAQDLEIPDREALRREFDEQLEAAP